MGWQEASSVSHRAQAVAAALDDLKRFPPADAALQTVHFVDKARGALVHLLRVAGVRPEVLQSLAAVADCGYSWGIMQSHVGRLQALVWRRYNRPPIPILDLSAPLICSQLRGSLADILTHVHRFAACDSAVPDWFITCATHSSSKGVAIPVSPSDIEYTVLLHKREVHSSASAGM